MSFQSQGGSADDIDEMNHLDYLLLQIQDFYGENPIPETSQQQQQPLCLNDREGIGAEVSSQPQHIDEMAGSDGQSLYSSVSSVRSWAEEETSFEDPQHQEQQLCSNCTPYPSERRPVIQDTPSSNNSSPLPKLNNQQKDSMEEKRAKNRVSAKQSRARKKKAEQDLKNRHESLLKEQGSLKAKIKKLKEKHRALYTFIIQELLLVQTDLHGKAGTMQNAEHSFGRPNGTYWLVNASTNQAHHVTGHNAVNGSMGGANTAAEDNQSTPDAALESLLSSVDFQTPENECFGTTPYNISATVKDNESGMPNEMFPLETCRPGQQLAVYGDRQEMLEPFIGSVSRQGIDNGFADGSTDVANANAINSNGENFNPCSYNEGFGCGYDRFQNLSPYINGNVGNTSNEALAENCRATTTRLSLRQFDSHNVNGNAWAVTHPDEDDDDSMKEVKEVVKGF